MPLTLKENTAALTVGADTGTEVYAEASYTKAGGAGGGNSFTTIDCPSGTDPVADSSSDTLTLAASAPITIVGDSALDKVTIGCETFADRASQALVAGTTIVATDGEAYTPITSSGAITLTAQPLIAAGRNGQIVLLKNTGAFNVIVQDVNALGGSLIRLTANTVTIQPGGTLALAYDTTIGFWIQQWILNPQTFTPSIASFTVDGSSGNSNHEVGGASSADTPTTHDFALTYVGTPSACSIDISGGEVSGSDYPVTMLTPFLSLTGQPNFYRATTISGTRVFTATATVAGTGGLTRTVTLTYLNRRYAGPNSQSTTLSSAQVLALDGAGGTSDISNSAVGSFSVDTTVGEYFWFAHRAALTTLVSMAATAFDGSAEIMGFSLMTSTLSHTNDSGFVENFKLYRSTNTNFGSLISFTTSSALQNNRIYMGPSTSVDPITNANILALDDTADGESIVSATLARTYTAIKIEAGEYLWFCHPSRTGDLATIKDGTTGFAIAGSYRTNVSHTNAMGYVETYRCWRSDNLAIYPSGENVAVT